MVGDDLLHKRPDVTVPAEEARSDRCRRDFGGLRGIQAASFGSGLMVFTAR